MSEPSGAPPPGGPPEAPLGFSGWLWRGGMAVIVGLALAAAVYQGVLEARRARLVAEGSLAPPFDLPRLGGGTVSLETFRGKVVMLDFWATWCPPCVAEMPSLVKLAAEYEAQGLVFVAANRIDSEQGAPRVSLFLERHVPARPPNMHVALAPEGMLDRYQVNALPTLYFIDREGKIGDAVSGQAPEVDLRRRIERALRSPGRN